MNKENIPLLLAFFGSIGACSIIIGIMKSDDYIRIGGIVIIIICVVTGMYFLNKQQKSEVVN